MSNVEIILIVMITGKYNNNTISKNDDKNCNKKSWMESWRIRAISSFHLLTFSSNFVNKVDEMAT